MKRIDIVIERFIGDDNFLQADGFDDAIIGVDQNTFGKRKKLVYSVSKCIEILIKQGMSDEEALEYFDFNVRGGYVGDQTPIWCDDDMFQTFNNELDLKEEELSKKKEIIISKFFTL